MRLTPIAKQCKDMNLKDQTWFSLSCSYQVLLGLPSIIVEKKGLFYRCTGRERNDDGQKWLPTYGCYIVASHNHGHEVDKQKWNDMSRRCNPGEEVAEPGFFVEFVENHSSLKI